MEEKKALKIDDADLGKVSGGYVETTGYSISHEIVCPNCGQEDEENFTTWIVSGEGEVDHFTCNVCGYSFTVDAYGIYGE